jgi:hypothetical protein
MYDHHQILGGLLDILLPVDYHLPQHSEVLTIVFVHLNCVLIFQFHHLLTNPS